MYFTHRLNGFYNGVGALVKNDEHIPEQLAINSSTPQQPIEATASPVFDPVAYNPYTEYNSYEYLNEHYPVQKCYIDREEHILPPDIFAYPGVPQNMTAPFMGSYKELGLTDDVCFDRFGRFGPYGYGYNLDEGGVGLAEKSDRTGVEKLWAQTPKIDYRKVDWGAAQQRCYEKNKKRFEGNVNLHPGEGKKNPVPRQAFILRTWTGYQYDEHQILTLRAMINELALRTGGEFDIHFLVHVKDNSIPIWTDKDVYRKTLEQNVPEEFWGLATLWSEQLMRLYYPDPFPDNLSNPSGQPVHGVYRSAHFALQWFSQHHPEYDFFWNWEMDLRYSGHYYEFLRQATSWAKKQPRKLLWERNARYYIPAYHGDWSQFTKTVEEETYRDNETPVWGPVSFPNSRMLPKTNDVTPPHSFAEDKYTWGVGEEADIITFNPLFDPSRTTWVFRDDINGYDLKFPAPPRRTAIITVARLSKRLLDLAHEETYKMKHTMFPEMWPPTVALHHGLKAVYIPHPQYFDRNWPLEYMDQTFNHPKKPFDSPFGGGEHNLLGSSFYYNSGFSGTLWRRWFGYKENGEGGTKEEAQGSGRMCLRSTLFHPIKKERGPTE